MRHDDELEDDDFLRRDRPPLHIFASMRHAILRFLFLCAFEPLFSSEEDDYHFSAPKVAHDAERCRAECFMIRLYTFSRAADFTMPRDYAPP
jgi:hypothetical protein